MEKTPHVQVNECSRNQCSLSTQTLKQPFYFWVAIAFLFVILTILSGFNAFGMRFETVNSLRITSKYVGPGFFSNGYGNYAESEATNGALHPVPINMKSSAFIEQEQMDAFKLAEYSTKMDRFKFFVTISNGHQGTTYLSYKKLYASTQQQDKSKIMFVFENEKSKIRYPCMSAQGYVKTICKGHDMTAGKTQSALRGWYRLGNKGKVVADKIQKVLLHDILIKHWESISKDDTESIFVSGHDNIYYFQGFADMLNRTTFIRLRRPRLETARSFSQCSSKYFLYRMFMPIHKRGCELNICPSQLNLPRWSYCPFNEQPFNVVLKVPMNVWMGFSAFQRALWYIDELEARWSLFQRQYSGAKIEEITWSKTNPEVYGSIVDATKTMARILRLKVKPISDSDNGIDDMFDNSEGNGKNNQKIHGKKSLQSMVHAKNLKGVNEDSLEERFQQQNEDYITKMNFSAFTKSLIHKVQF